MRKDNMTLFGDTCPCCGQPMPDAPSTPFDAFWNDCPHKVGKEQARKAFGKLTAQERQLARERVKAFYQWFKRTYKDASPLHPSTYLNNKRWTDVAAPAKVDPALAVVNNIKSGKRFLCTNISSAQARSLIHRGLVTEDECREVGVI